MTGAVIGRFVLEVAAATRETAAEAETALLPVLQGDSLLALLDECLDELPEIADPVWIDEFTVDLGHVPLSIHHDDLRQRAKAAIRQQLASRIADARRDDPAAVSDGGTRPISPLFVLVQFLAQGVIHWSHAAPVDVAALVDDAAAHDLSGFRALLRAAMADPYQAQRLATHLSPEQIARLSVVVAPQAGGLLARLHRVFVELHRTLPLTDRAAPDVLAAANRALLEAGTRLGSVWISEARVADEFATSIARNLRLDTDSLKSGIIARLHDPRRPQYFAGAEVEAFSGLAEGGQGQDSLASANQARGAAGVADNGEGLVDPGAAERGRESRHADAVAYFLRTGLPFAPQDAGPRRLLDQSMLRRALLSWLPREGQAGLVWLTLRRRLDTAAEGNPALVLTRLQMLLSPADARRALQRLGYAMPEAGSPAATPVPPDGLDDIANRQDDAIGEGDRERDLELFWYLMEFGAIPWWGREAVQASADQWTRAFTADHASRIAGSLRAMMENRRALLLERMGVRLSLEPIGWIVGAASPGLRREAADWLARLPDVYRLLSARVVANMAEGQPVPATEQWLSAVAATLLARLFDPHAPALDWPDLQRQVAGSVARRLRLPEEAMLQAFADGDPNAAPLIAEPGERLLLPEMGTAGLPPHAGEGQRPGTPARRRFGQPAAAQVNEAEIVRRFLTLSAIAPEAEVVEASVRALLAEPVARASIVASLPAPQLQRLGERLGMTGGSLLPSEVRVLDALLTAAWPGGGGPGWVADTISAVLAGWSKVDAGPETGIIPQVRRILLAFARQEGADYEAILRRMADEAAEAADGGKANSSRVAAALIALASTAAADAPVRNAGGTEANAELSGFVPDAASGAGLTNGLVGTGGSERARERDAWPINERLSGARSASAAPSELPPSPALSADWPLRETGSLELADRLLFDAAASGRAEAKAVVRAMLLVPVYRARLSARIESADLDRLAGALLNVAGAAEPSAIEAGGLLDLGRLVAVVVPGIQAVAWRRAVAEEALRLLAEEPLLSARSSFYRQVLVGAAAVLNLEGEEAGDWARDLLDAEGTGGIRIAAAVRQSLLGIRDASGKLADAEDAGLAEVLADLRGHRDALSEGLFAPASDLANLLERFLARERAGIDQFQAAMGIPAHRRMVAARLSPALLDRLGAILLSWDSAPSPGEIANLGALIARQTGQIAPARWRETVADQVLTLIAEAVDEMPKDAAIQLVLSRSLRTVAADADGVAFLARDIVTGAEGAEAGISAPLANALHRIAAIGDLPSDVPAEAGADARAGEGAGGDTATTEPAIPPEPRWQSLPLAMLTELFLAKADTGGPREAMAGLLQRRLQEPDAALSLRNAFPESTLNRLSEALVGLGADAASLFILQERVATEAQPSPDWPSREAVSLSAPEPEPEPEPEQGSYWSANRFHALPGLVQTLIVMPRTVPPFREVAETVWTGLFSAEGKTKAQDFVSPQTLRTAARILRQAGYLVPDAEGLWDGQSPAAVSSVVAPAEEWSLETIARALLAKPSNTQNQPGAEKVWHGLSLRAGRAVITAAFSLADRAELLRVLATAGYRLTQQQRAGLGILDGVGPGGGEPSVPGAVAKAEASGEAGAPPPDRAVPDTPPVGERRAEQQPAPGLRDPDAWPWQDESEGVGDLARELLFVEDAGAVLLWPFLVHYFDRIGLLVEGRFASEEAAARGVMLIHYLATANTETEEPQLVLPKLLCGVLFETPVTPRIDLTEMEQTVSDELLNVVCQNWPPLRNSSVDALRETFLKREGSLSWLEERIWVLNVTAKPYDMLLGQLPWTLSTFKTPLMRHPMMVQWGQQ